MISMIKWAPLSRVSQHEATVRSRSLFLFVTRRGRGISSSQVVKRVSKMEEEIKSDLSGKIKSAQMWLQLPRAESIK